jgi:hypothetical protein
MALTADSGLRLNAYSAESGSPSSEARTLLATDRCRATTCSAGRTLPLGRGALEVVVRKLDGTVCHRLWA